MKFKIQFLALIIFCFYATGAAAQEKNRKSADDLITSHYSRLSLTVSIKNKPSVEVLAFASLTNPKYIWLNEKDFYEKINPLISPLYIENLKKEIKPDSELYFSVLSLEKLGWGIAFDDFEVKLDVPIDQLALENHSIQNFNSEYHDFLTPADYSGYLNINVGQDVDESTNNDLFTANLNPVLNIKSFVLDSRYDYNRTQANQWSREQTTLSKDLEDHLVRLYAGDINIVPIGFQDYGSVLGVGFSKIYGIDPTINTNIVGRREFYLERPALVDVFVNGMLVRSLNLDAGKHALDDIPLVNGVNNIVLRVTERDGRQELIPFQQSSSTSILKKGFADYSFGAGVSADPSSAQKNYLPDSIISGYYRYGLSDSLTADGYLQTSTSYWLTGVDAAFSDLNGTWSLGPAISQKSGSSGYGARLLYDLQKNGISLSALDKISFGLEYRSSGFYRLSEVISPVHPDDYDFSVSYLHGVTDNLTLTDQINFSITDFSSIISYSVNTGVNYKVLHNLSLSLQATGLQVVAGDFQYSAMLLATLDLSVVHQYVSTQASDNQGQVGTSATWNYNPGDVNDTFNSHVVVAQAANTTTGDGTLGYTHQRFEGYIEHTSTTDNGNMQRDQKTHFDFSTALAFAGSHGGITKPITDSFALINPVGLLKDKKITVDRSTDAYLASSDGLSAVAIVPTLQSYQPKRVNIMADYSNEISLFNQFYDLKPTYKSGLLVTIGEEVGYQISATIVDVDKKPISLKAGELVPVRVAHSRKDQIILFTDYDGKIFVENVFPGDYMLVIGNGSLAEIAVTIKESSDPIINLGTLEIKNK